MALCARLKVGLAASEGVGRIDSNGVGQFGRFALDATFIKNAGPITDGHAIGQGSCACQHEQEAGEQ